jgi:putative restriction endonuclease
VSGNFYVISNDRNPVISDGRFHRAFDRHLICIDDDYRVVVSTSFVERCDSPYSIQQFKGKHILLPPEKRFYPALENLKAHRNELTA